MPAEQQKSGKWRIKKKDGTLGKRDFTSKKNALAAQRGGGAKGKPKAKPKGKGKAATTTTASKMPGIGRSYQGAKATAMILAPATHQAIGVLDKGRKPGVAGAQLVAVVKGREHLKHQAINIADIVIDRSRRVGQAAALSRGSVTAWAPEVYLAGKALEDIFIEDQSAEVVHNRFIARQTGYAPLNDNLVASRARSYRLLKHVGQAARIAASRLPVLNRAKRALQELVLRPIGATL